MGGEERGGLSPEACGRSARLVSIDWSWCRPWKRQIRRHQPRQQQGGAMALAAAASRMVDPVPPASGQAMRATANLEHYPWEGGSAAFSPENSKEG